SLLATILPEATPGPRAGVRLGVEGGQLCRLLRSPDYNLFPCSAVFESNFLQVGGGESRASVTWTGSSVDIHNAATPVILGVTSSDPCLPLPNILVLVRGGSPPERPALTLSRQCHARRVLPLRLVQLSVPAGAGRLLRVRTATGKVHYLRLHPSHPDAVFTLWVRLAHILRHGLSFTAPDTSAGSSVAKPSMGPEGSASPPLGPILVLSKWQGEGGAALFWGKWCRTNDAAVANGVGRIWRNQPPPWPCSSGACSPQGPRWWPGGSVSMVTAHKAPRWRPGGLHLHGDSPQGPKMAARGAPSPW
uniref:Family with sequence similarity 71 member F1 n=1 Tax=Apteryx owenii TaxID=8824 RepID=A0A8B9Q0C0_APTOW